MGCGSGIGGRAPGCADDDGGCAGPERGRSIGCGSGNGGRKDDTVWRDGACPSVRIGVFGRSPGFAGRSPPPGGLPIAIRPPPCRIRSLISRPARSFVPQKKSAGPPPHRRPRGRREDYRQSPQNWKYSGPPTPPRGGRSPTRWSPRNRTNSRARRRFPSRAPYAEQDRSASPPTGCRG